MTREPGPRARAEHWFERQYLGRWRVLASGLLAGAIAALGQAPFGVFPATLIGLALGAGLIVSAPTARWAAFAAWSLGLGYFTVTLVWIVQPFLVDIARHGWMAPFALFFMAGGMALFWAAAGGAAARVSRGRMFWLAFGAAIGLAELLRGWIFGGFPWGGPGLVWIDTPVAGLARFVGVYGLSAVTVALGAATWPAVASLRGRITWFASVVVLSLAALGATPEAPDPSDKVVRLVQPNAPQHLKWDPDWIMTFFERAIALSAHEGTADLVVWPETSIPSPLGRAPELERMAAEAAAPAPLVAGIQRIEGRTWRNAMALYDGPGEPLWVYDKHHLVPFGEYVPLGDLAARFGIYGFAQQDGNGYAPGPGATVNLLPDELGSVLPLICYEMIFPRDIRAAETRADWILQATNDAWFGTFSGPQQHLVQARFRAIEFGLPIARAANTGISAMIDATGQVTASLPLGEAGAIEANLPRALPRTLYSRFGDIPLLVLCLAVLAGLGVAGRMKRIDRGAAGR